MFFANYFAIFNRCITSFSYCMYKRIWVTGKQSALDWWQKSKPNLTMNHHVCLHYTWPWHWLWVCLFQIAIFVIIFFLICFNLLLCEMLFCAPFPNFKGIHKARAWRILQCLSRDILTLLFISLCSNWVSNQWKLLLGS